MELARNTAGRCATELLAPFFGVLVLTGLLSMDSSAGHAASLEYEPDVVLVIKQSTFELIKGNAVAIDSVHPAFALSPGADIALELRNEDKLPHEFVSPLFMMVEFQFSGRATLVYTHTATGIRIDPGETVGLRFELPAGFMGKQFKFWCNVHGKLHDDALQGEVFVVKAKQGVSKQ